MWYLIVLLIFWKLFYSLKLELEEYKSAYSAGEVRKRKDNKFVALVEFCKANGVKFGSKLLDYSLLDKKVVMTYFNICMPTLVGIDFSSDMRTDALTQVTTISEEAYAALLFENYFERWMYQAKEELDNEERENREKYQKILNVESGEIDSSDVEGDDNDSRDVGDDNGHNDGDEVSKEKDDLGDVDRDNGDNVPDVLYQKKVKTRKDKRVTAGRWTYEGMERLNEFFEVVISFRDCDDRKEWEKELKEEYRELAIKSGKEAYFNKKKAQEEKEETKKKVKLRNLLNIAEL